MRMSAKPIGWSLAVAIVASSLSGAGPTGAQTVAVAPSNTIQVSIGRGRLVTLAKPMSDLFVASDAVADVQVRSPTQLYIFGKSAGETTVYATAKNGSVVYSTTVRVGNNIDSVGQMLTLALPDAKITTTPMNGLVLLTGTVGAPDDAAEAERLVQAYMGDTVKIISRLKTATPLTVNLQVKFAEVSKNFAKNIGVNLTNRDNGAFQFGVAQGRQGLIRTEVLPNIPGLQANPSGANIGDTLFGFPQGTTSGLLLGAAGKFLGTDLLSSLELGERNGQVSTLANPNLTALSGETGTFLAGGEIPIPISQGLGMISVEYKQFGVSLAFTPTVLSDGRISLRVRPEVSQLTSVGSVQLNGTTIPALTTRRAETTVELGSGQSYMIAGLIQNNHNNSIDQAPGLGDVPILGALFRSNSFQRNETELVIVITPYLVKPVNANDIVLPTDAYKSVSDLDRIFTGKLSSGVTGGDRPKPSVAPSRTTAPGVGATSQQSFAPSPTLPSPSPMMPMQDDKKATPVSSVQRRSNSALPGFSFK